jgi:outer membrane protein
MRTIDTKEKALQRDAQDAQQAYNGDLQESLGKVAQKLGPTVVNYVKSNGYTLLLDLSAQQSQGGVSVMWAAEGTDISQAVIEAYNASSGVAAPAPSAPTPAAARPRSTTPHASTTKK